LSWYEVFASRLTSLNPASYAVGAIQAQRRVVQVCKHENVYKLKNDLEIEEWKRHRNKGKGGRIGIAWG
ncbi:hypothetical protein T11_5991, partial [Trichinella zimbabwensis]